MRKTKTYDPKMIQDVCDMMTETMKDTRHYKREFVYKWVNTTWAMEFF
jgi:hypothetical protein